MNLTVPVTSVPLLVRSDKALLDYAPRVVKPAIVVACTVAILFASTTGVGAQSTAAATTPRALAAACTSTDPSAAWTPAQVAEVRATTLCMLRAVRREQHSDTVLDARLNTAAAAGLNFGVALDAKTARDPIGQISRFLDRRMASRCRRPSHVHFDGNDTGANGTAETPLQLAGWVIAAERKPTVSVTIPRFNAKHVRFAVVARPGRFVEGTRSGAVAVLIAGFRCF